MAKSAPRGHPRPISLDDLFRFRLVSDPQISPGGEHIVYVVSRTDLEKNKYFSNLRLVRSNGEGDRPFTHGDQSDTSPRWAPFGGSLAFTSNRGERSQLWRILLDGGEAEPLTELDEGSIGEFHWSPDGSRIAFTFRPAPPWARKEEVEKRQKDHRSPPPILIRRLHFRSEGEGYFGDERWHIYVLRLDDGEVQQLTRGETDQGCLAWSPDSREIAFVTNRSEDPDRTPQFEEIRVIPADGGDERVVAAPAGPKHQLAWSPDGDHLAYLGTDDVSDVWSPADPHLWVVPAGGGEGRNLSASLDLAAGDFTLGDLRSFGGGWPGPCWSPDSSRITFLASTRGSCHVFRVPLSDGEPEDLTPGFEGEVASLSLDAGGRRLAAIVGTASEPGTVGIAATQPAPLRFRLLTDTNREVLAEIALSPPEEFSVEGDGGEVHGWLIRPTGPEHAGKPAPVILYIHGGPHTQYGWSLMHEFQLLAAHGFAVVYANPRGSRGYGQAHVAAIRGDWGGPDYRDLMAVVDWACRQPGVQERPHCVIGGSYGGYMTNWIVGHTDRFRSAFTDRSVVNLQSMAGTCDFNFGQTEYFGGNAWDQPERLLSQSPLSFAADITTPLFILHSEGDLRCPIEQAEQLFAALRCQGKTAEFIRYPKEANHGLSRGGPPDLRRDRLERVLAWMERWRR